MMTTAHDYAAANAERFRRQLYGLLRIPSISTLPEHEADIQRAAEWLAADMRRISFDSAEIIPTAGHPVVYGEWLGAGPEALTVLVYGHYDVQPAAREDGWDSEPFEPVERDGFIYCRGASDDKGQVFLQLKAAESLLANGAKAPVNLKFIIEGEEEVGSPNIGGFFRQNVQRLAADVCVISDTGMPDPQQPSIVYALRGLMAVELIVQGPATDLHSGQYGGTVHNPVGALAEIVAQLHHPDGSIAVPGFYDDVVPLTPEERVELEKQPWDVAQWQKTTGAPRPWGEPQYSLRERVGARPTLELNGIVGGFYGEGLKTVLPARAMAKISCRLVARQSPQRIYELIRDHIAAITPPTVRSEIRLLKGNGHPVLVERDTPAMQAAVAAYEKGWGAKPIFMREGGSIPIVADFQQQLGLPVILMGYGLDDSGAHGPNEHFSVEMFHRGIDTAIHFFEEAARMK